MTRTYLHTHTYTHTCTRTVLTVHRWTPPFPNGECAISIFELCGVFINAMHAAKLIQVRAISERAHFMFVGLCHFFVSWKCFGVNDSTAAKAKNKL